VLINNVLFTWSIHLLTHGISISRVRGKMRVAGRAMVCLRPAFLRFACRGSDQISARAASV
jgi:hypothetical protein